jgi:hypothetical protein
MTRPTCLTHMFLTPCLLHWDFSNESVLCNTLGIIGKHLMSKGALFNGFVMFRSTMYELFNIEQFFHWKFNTIIF